jgi:hypothetical protein
MIIIGTGTSTGPWTEKRTSHDYNRDRILDRDMDREKTRHDHNWDRNLDRDMDMDREKDES